jgi:hypothetical protein
MVKWTKKYGICKLLAGLILLTANCAGKTPHLQLTAVKQLPDFPSASAIEYSNNRLYVFGDDAAYALVLDTAFHQIDTIRYLPDTAYRIDKDKKADVESATIMPFHQTTAIVAFGSMSTRNRFMAFAFPVAVPYEVSSMPLADLAKALNNIKERNIEGAAYVAGRLVLSNRAHNKNPINQLAVFNLNRQEFDTAQLIQIQLNKGQNVIGISGLYYAEAMDRLFFTASEEATASTYADGAIGNSYIGWIDNFTKQLLKQTIKPDGFIPLQTVDPQFEKVKIEGLCVTQTQHNEVTLILVADNDDGKSTLFKLTLTD